MTPWIHPHPPTRLLPPADLRPRQSGGLLLALAGMLIAGSVLLIPW